MKKITLRSGDQMPALGLGTWKADESTYPAIREAIKIGYRHFDCALRYENEKEVGRAIRDAIKEGQVDRQSIWLTSKLWNNAHLSHDVRPALEESLMNLGMDYLDLYLMHWPVALKPDVIFPDKGSDFLSLEQAPLIDTWRALEECVDAGLCRNIGVSNFSIKKLKDLRNSARIAPTCNQVELHPFLQQKELVEYCLGERIAVTAYSPLGSKDRPARLHQDDEPILLEHPEIRSITGIHDCTAAQVLIAWALQRGTSVIPKSANPNRLRENYQAQNITLNEDNMKRIGNLDRHYRYIHGAFWTIEGSPYTLTTLWDEPIS